jgi:hypothetical protein
VERRESAEPTGDSTEERSEEGGGVETTSGAAGWRAQPLALKLLLFVSLAFIAVGVYRCSVELVPAPGARSIRVERATVAVPDTLLAIPADSLASLTTRLFARELRGAHEGDVALGELTEAWAVARLHVRAVSDGRIELVGTASSPVSGRRMSAVSGSDTPDRLREIAEETASEMAQQLAADESATEER